MQQITLLFDFMNCKKQKTQAVCTGLGFAESTRILYSGPRVGIKITTYTYDLYKNNKNTIPNGGPLRGPKIRNTTYSDEY